jgi:hypothetical protein
MTDTQLLTQLDWQRFTDRDLRRAITLAKIRGRQTFALLLARYEEQQVSLPPASGDLYTAHCILTFAEGKLVNEEWEDRIIIDWCNDPRVAHFCTIYDQYWRRHQGLKRLPRNAPFLQARANHACAKVDQLQQQVLANRFLCQLATSEQQSRMMNDRMEKNQTLFNAALDFSMLTLMEIQAYTDHLLGRPRPAR